MTLTAGKCQFRTSRGSLPPLGYQARNRAFGNFKSKPNITA